uniref:Response regulator, GGDEF family n=1 Tax=uncultured bacterium A1Q1_fos_300 TaxID=1256571 RepID=L7VWE6_9BACT|nr:response regulator, GGDEF family [uncultured bacterium A1Q1_fos_300]
MSEFLLVPLLVVWVACQVQENTALTQPDTFIEHYERKIHSQKQLIELSKALNSNLDLPSLIDSILNVSIAQSRCLQAGIYLVPEIDHHGLVLDENLVGFEVSDPTAFTIPYKSDIVKLLSEYPTLLTLTEIKNIAAATGHSSLAQVSYNDAIAQLSKLNSELLLVPLKAKGRINGILVMGPKSDGETYLAEEKAFLSDLASLAAIAVENARLYELATVDMMTKLKIHHFFQTRLREELENARDTGESVCLLLTDIDHFKKFNDTYGHQIGDLVLKEVAKVLIGIARGKDVAARYGGEEFALIAPAKNLEAGRAIAEKYREKIEKLAVKNPSNKGEKTLKVTVSVGVAMFNAETDLENKHLIERADQALYAAKHGGRNRVETK